MHASRSKEHILKKIRQALAKPVPVPFPSTEKNDAFLFQPSTQELEVEFAENFTKLLGKFSFCASERELADQLNQLVAARRWENIFCREAQLKYMLNSNGYKNFEYADLNTCQASITSCELLIARTGSIMLSSGQQSGRATSVYAPVHICIAYTDQLVYDIKDSMEHVQDKYKDSFPSLVTLATGPSRTADIEKTLVVGIHGPKEVFVFLVEKTGSLI
jgi:L-lactate dehydrogenase complex protein LldG